MAGWCRRPALVALALLAPAAVSAAPRFPSHTVRIDVAVADGTAHVDESYDLDAPVGDASFEFLADACSSVGPISATAGGRPLTLTASHHGPWTTLQAGVDSAAPIRLRYDVQVQGAAIPIVMPAAALGPAGQLRGADVSLQVRFANASEAATVLLPRFDRGEQPGTWRARMLAIPSTVRVRVPGAGVCGRALAGTTGGLGWRFWIFVLTMVAWVPIYFWWFGRRDA